MQLKGLYDIRKKKKVSRKRLAQDLGLTVEYIKALELSDTESVGNNLIKMFSDYFKCSPFYIINNRESINILEETIEHNEIEVPKNISEVESNFIFFEVLKKYSPIDQNNIQDVIKEFKYRLEEASIFKNEEDEDEQESLEETSLEDSIEITEEVVKNIRHDAKTLAIMYKELRACGLSREDSFSILKIIWNS